MGRLLFVITSKCFSLKIYIYAVFTVRLHTDIWCNDWCNYKWTYRRFPGAERGEQTRIIICLLEVEITVKFQKSSTPLFWQAMRVATGACVAGWLAIYFAQVGFSFDLFCFLDIRVEWPCMCNLDCCKREQRLWILDDWLLDMEWESFLMWYIFQSFLPLILSSLFPLCCSVTTMYS